jgi:hypothetical protein
MTAISFNVIAAGAFPLRVARLPEIGKTMGNR